MKYPTSLPRDGSDSLPTAVNSDHVIHGVLAHGRENNYFRRHTVSASRAGHNFVILNLTSLQAW